MNGSINILDLVIHASWPVVFVLAILVVFSFTSWVIIFRKKMMLDATTRDADDFEERFWSGVDLAALFREVSNRAGEAGGLAAVFESGFREFVRQRQRGGEDRRAVLESSERAMRVAGTREVEKLERNLEYLANVGSISTYVGLFGTVWGIMIAFQGLGTMKQATIATVAPGISEALVATAMGLVAAIPAVWAYNRYSTRLDRLTLRYETFQEEFSSVLQRQMHADEQPTAPAPGRAEARVR
ncbi:MAG: protein TolQ [Xanthomonadaceae bacterium]|nr:protein TolQ [Xanthomonadaceae bacterium]MBU6477111.1 protein TolQ [Xanthomonadaceae bacterium]MDE2053077.1 protein TolQ [Xanthomonadaceae bacterium]MDE2223653.1 protein TolQ [Xanthomonadaceae bacterium]MDE2496731.1 protein TolQ [Xanthomonadaceae bacterium]